MKEQHQSRFHVPFQSQWKMRIDHPYSLWVRDGEVGWSCGQCPLDPRGEVVAPGDLRAQTRFVIDMIEANLQSGQLGSGGALLMIIMCRTRLRPPFMNRWRRLVCAVLIVPVAVPQFYHEGIPVETTPGAAHGTKLRQHRYWPTNFDRRGRRAGPWQDRDQPRLSWPTGRIRRRVALTARWPSTDRRAGN
jgi:hypothetical protein